MAQKRTPGAVVRKHPGYTRRIREAVSRIVDSLPADEPLRAAVMGFCTPKQ